MAAQMIVGACGRVGTGAAVACNAASKVEVPAAAASATTTALFATRGAFRALAVACGALGCVGLWYSRWGVGLRKYLLSPATSRPRRHDRERAAGQRMEWSGTRLRTSRELRRLTRN